MRLVDREPVALELGQLRRQLEELLHADGKIRAIEKGSALLRFGLEFGKMRVPPRSSYHNAPTQGQHGADILNSRFGSCEVDDDIDTGQVRSRERRGMRVFVDVEGAHAVAALARHFGDERAGFSFAQH